LAEGYQRSDISDREAGKKRWKSQKLKVKEFGKSRDNAPTRSPRCSGRGRVNAEKRDCKEGILTTEDTENTEEVKDNAEARSSRRGAEEEKSDERTYIKGAEKSEF